MPTPFVRLEDSLVQYKVHIVPMVQADRDTLEYAAYELENAGFTMMALHLKVIVEVFDNATTREIDVKVEDAD